MRKISKLFLTIAMMSTVVAGSSYAADGVL